MGAPRKIKKRDKRVSIRLPSELHAAIVRAAERDHRSVASWIMVKLDGVIRAESDK